MTTESYPPEQNYVHRPCRRPQSRRPQASLQRSQLFPQSRRAEERNMHQPRLPIDRRKSQDDHSIEYHIEYHSKSINQTPTPLTTSPASHPFPSNPDPISSHKTKSASIPRGKGLPASPSPLRSESRRAANHVASQAPTFLGPKTRRSGPQNARSRIGPTSGRAQPNQSSAGPWSDRDWSGR